MVGMVACFGSESLAFAFDLTSPRLAASLLSPPGLIRLSGIIGGWGGGGAGGVWGRNNNFCCSNLVFFFDASY